MNKYRVCGSNNGTEWNTFAYAGSLQEAREKASSCILKTKHSYVRIQLLDIDNAYERRFV